MSKKLITLLFCFSLIAPISCASEKRKLIYPTSKEVIQNNAQSLIKNHPPKTNRGIEIIDLGRSQTQSYHLVWIKTQEKLHYHKDHDSTVTILQGSGNLVLGSDQIQLKEGDVVSIPRKTVHSFTNTSKKPVAAYVVFSPPFDGKDFIRIGSQVK